MRHPTGLLLLALCFSTLTANAADEHAGHHSSEHNHIGNEPIGVMGAHAHSQGDWMFSYRFMRMDMDGNRDDSDRVSTSKVLKDYMIAPKSMTMDMHMVGAMYGVNDDVTVMLMVPYLDVEMDHVTRMGAKFTTRTHGIGDVKLSSLIRLQEWNGGQLNLNAGISIPTGSIDEKDDTPAGANQHLPYPMQPGSGTYDLMPGLTYLGNNDSLSWGAQGVGTIRLSDNDNDYSLGDRFNLTTWIVRDWTSQFSSSLRVNGEWWGNIDGSDRKLMRALLQEKQITRVKSVGCLGLAVLADARTRYGALPEPTMVRLVDVVVPAAEADELYDYIYDKAEIGRDGGGAIWLASLSVASPYALPADIPPEKD